MLSEDQMRDMLPSCYPEKTNTVNSLLPYCYTKKSPTVVQNSPARAQIQAEYLIYTEAFKKPQNRRDMSTIPVIFYIPVWTSHGCIHWEGWQRRMECCRPHGIWISQAVTLQNYLLFFLQKSSKKGQHQYQDQPKSIQQSTAHSHFFSLAEIFSCLSVHNKISCHTKVFRTV